VVILQAQVNYVSRTSMEVGCRVETEEMAQRTRRYTTKAYLTFVAVDAKGKPRGVPDLVLVTDDDRRRNAAAAARREDRLRAAGRLRRETST
jgi:acyl-CoA hydrolase